MSFDIVASPWDWFAQSSALSEPALCNICWWQGSSFLGVSHSEGAACPDCGSIARDRFLFLCFTSRMRSGPYRLLETSPRLGADYRFSMARWFSYTASDFDERAHRAEVKLDVQDMSLDDESFDVILTAHVLEHVPDTGRALNEFFRILKPGGRVFLQVPVLQGWTAPPAMPEFHGDNTAVEWRFGFDLTDRIRRHGFHASLLCTSGFYRHVRHGALYWPDPAAPEVDVESFFSAANSRDLIPIANDELARRLSFQPSYMFLTWECAKP